jgi:hypothetical protein
MALLWMDGFDQYQIIGSDASLNLAKAYTVNNSLRISSNPGRYDNYSMGFASNKYGTTKIYKAITPTAGTTHLILGFNIYVLIYNRDAYINSSWNGATNGISIILNSLKCANNTVATLSYNTWNHIEARIPITTSGSNKYELYLNGVTVFSSSSANFAWNNGLHFGCINSNYSETEFFLLDDLYVMDDTGTTNNARIGTELYIPRIETQFPVDDVTNDFTPSYTPLGTVNDGFESLASGTNGATLASYLETTFGFFNNYRLVVAESNISVKSGDGGDRTGSRSLVISQSSSTKTYIEFSTIADSISFYVSAYYTSVYPTQLAITVNGTTTNTTINNDYGQTNWTLITLTLDSTKVNRVRIGHGASSVHLSGIKLDDFTVVHTGKNAAQSLCKVPGTSAYVQSSTNGNKLIGNISNLTNITDVKAVGFMPLLSESVSGQTSSYKYIANNGGSDTEIGTTQSVTGSTTARVLQLFDINPLTSTAWTASNFNALKAGDESMDWEKSIELNLSISH